MAKSVGRDNKSKTQKENIFRIKKDKTAGPGTYKIEEGMKLMSNNLKSTGVHFHGFSVTEGMKPNITNTEK